MEKNLSLFKKGGYPTKIALLELKQIDEIIVALADHHTIRFATLKYNTK